MGSGSLLPDLGTLGVAGAGVGLAVGLWRATPWLLGPAYASCAAGVFPAAAAGAAGAPLLGGFAAWQWLSAGAFAANVASVSVPGRIDGKMAEEARKARADGASKDDAPGVPRDSRESPPLSPSSHPFSLASTFTRDSSRLFFGFSTSRGVTSRVRSHQVLCIVDVFECRMFSSPQNSCQ
jgi:hypothetical protein